LQVENGAESPPPATTTTTQNANTPELLFGNLRPISVSQRLLMSVDGMFVAPLMLLRELYTVTWARDKNPLHDRNLASKKDEEEGRYVKQFNRRPAGAQLLIRPCAYSAVLDVILLFPCNLTPSMSRLR
jgi:hypothetical protein